MEVLRFSDLLKKASEKASDVLHSLGIEIIFGCIIDFRLRNPSCLGDPVKFIGKDGELIYSKNNVCVHAIGSSEEAKHCPGYFSVICQKNELYPGAVTVRLPMGYSSFDASSGMKVCFSCLPYRVDQKAVSLIGYYVACSYKLIN
ncbi:hypothetical protein D918_00283 [Trichuris suis]|nr:hypothetical protein D918_00283 [Trichuris suis]